MRTELANLTASVRQRLLNLSREKGEDFNLVLTRYGLERFLYRLSISDHAERFVLKGAMLFAVWMDQTHRPTRDLDLFSYGDDSAESLTVLFKEVCQVEVEPDGLVFNPESVRAEQIREDQEYQGLRVRLLGLLANAEVPVQVDVGFGDVITPRAESIQYPTLLEMPPPMIRAYPKESVVSEKLEAIVRFGMVNSRMKDFYDIWIISKQFPFDGHTLVRAIQATFGRRGTPLPKTVPVGLSKDFAKDRGKSAQWKAFLNRTVLTDTDIDLEKVLDDLLAFLMTPLQAAARSKPYKRTWIEGGPWTKDS